MHIKITHKTWRAELGRVWADEEYDVDDELGQELVAAGAAVEMSAAEVEASEPEPESTPEPEPKPKARARKRTKQ